MAQSLLKYSTQKPFRLDTTSKVLTIARYILHYFNDLRFRKTAGTMSPAGQHAGITRQKNDRGDDGNSEGLSEISIGKLADGTDIDDRLAVSRIFHTGLCP